MKLKNIAKVLLPIADFLLAIPLLPAAYVFRQIRRARLDRMPACKWVFMKVGVIPVIDHYYEPLIRGDSLARPLSASRSLPGIDWNVDEQLALLDSFDYAAELADVPMAKTASLEFHFNNGAFESGDAEYLYNFIRKTKPKRIFEVGSGNSTLMARCAIARNMQDDAGYRCQHVCIEPYEMPWLEQCGVTVMRKKVEDVPLSFFSELEASDLLFIDSSHIIRPQGDVLFEYLELLPQLNAGVYVHVHDIFTPRDYPAEWIVDRVWFWNEQYLLEAFLTHNKDWRVVGALNLLHHDHPAAFKRACPHITAEREPGSFYIQKR